LDVAISAPVTDLADHLRFFPAFLLPAGRAWVLRWCLLFGSLTLLVGCAASDSRPPSVNIRTSTEIERRATLSILRRAWEDRPSGNSDDHCWYERRLLNRSAYFGRQVQHTETYVAACQFWSSSLREHLDAYDDDYFKGYKRN
jgi:hypothetical protein